MMRALGVDDAPFDFEDDEVMVVGSIVRAPNYLEGVLSTTVEVDGTDATEKMIEMAGKSRFTDQVKIIFTDGAALGGFNIIDMYRVYEETGIPIASVSRDEPDFESIKKALKDHLSDWENRYQKIKEGTIHEIETEHKPIYVKVVGLDMKETERLIRLFTVRGRIPEPIRMSHIVASGVVKGESRGKP